MGFKKGENPHHPRKGAAIKVDPIRDLDMIARIKQNLILSNKQREHCLFTLGINTAWRGSELLSIKVGQVRYLNTGDRLVLKQPKTGKYRSTPLNRTTMRAIEFWLAVYGDDVSDKAPLFPSFQAGALRVPTLCNMVKLWCSEAGGNGHYGSHTLRKTWAYHQRVSFQSPLPLIMNALGHTSERQTLSYIGIQPREVDELYMMEL